MWKSPAQFHYFAAYIYNSLPVQIKNAGLHAFKRLVSEYMLTLLDKWMRKLESFTLISDLPWLGQLFLFFFCYIPSIYVIC